MDEMTDKLKVTNDNMKMLMPHFYSCMNSVDIILIFALHHSNGHKDFVRRSCNYYMQKYATRKNVATDVQLLPRTYYLLIFGSCKS